MNFQNLGQKKDRADLNRDTRLTPEAITSLPPDYPKEYPQQKPLH